jgi:DNA-binding transcriptional LysR family regulator
MDNELFDLRQLEAFAAVMSSGSVTGAAKLVGKSQPVVTRLIQDLESELGFDLFARHGRRITPTQNGTMFYKEVEILLNGAVRTRQRALDLAKRQTQTIEIVATASLAGSIVPRALATLRQKKILPQNITLRTQLPEDVMQIVASRGADIGIASLPLDNPGLEVHWIAEAACVCVLAQDDPLASLDTVPIKMLAGRSLITMSNPYRVLGRISAAIDRAHVTSSQIIKTNSSTTAIALVQAGLGVALLEPLTPTTLLVPGVVVRPLDVDIPYLWGIVSPIGLPESPIITPLIEALIEASNLDLPGFKVRDVKQIESILKNIYDYDGGRETD